MDGLEEVFVEDVLCEPELPVLLHDLFLNHRRNLNLRRNSGRQPALSKRLLRSQLVGSSRLARKRDLGVFLELFETLLVDKVFPLVNQNVGVVVLHTALILERLHHCWVIGMLPDLGFKVLVLTAESLARNVVWIKLFDFLVVEAEPRLIILALSVLDIAVVMASLRSTSMHDDALKFELVVRIGKLAV